jgi:hypothetical protein
VEDHPGDRAAAGGKAGFGCGTVWNMFERIAGGSSSSDERAVIFDGAARRLCRI